MQATVSAADIAAYPEFAAAMDAGGNGHDWRSYQVETSTGHILTVFRITGDNAAIPASSRGPLLLQHGLFSNACSWFERSDNLSAAYPVQLFELGFDVWVAAGRGTKESLGHTTLDYVADGALYWDWTFAEAGKVDVPEVAQFIVDERTDDLCAKVTVVSHSTAITEVIAAGLNDPKLGSTIDRVVALAPCMFLNLRDFELPIGDRPSAQALFGLL